MLVCGLKLTHDGGVAIVENGRLVVSVEVEKLDNRFRHSELDDLALVDRVLEEQGIEVGDIDAFAVDGWGYGESNPTVQTTRNGQPLSLQVAPYREGQVSDDSLAGFEFDGLVVAEKRVPYRSYRHTTGHVLSAYCASPFAQRHESSYVLVWDGGVLPRLYHVRPQAGGVAVRNLGPILGLIGNVYATFAMHFRPFRPVDLVGPPERHRYAQLTIPGKVMAFTALGEVREDLCRVLDHIYENELEISLTFGDTLARSFLHWTAHLSYEPADALASFQHWMGRRLLDSLAELQDLRTSGTRNLCLSGGCALNIKWNTAIRRSGLFADCWVPPFPNDSGSAIGAACGEMVRNGMAALNWSAYSGRSVAGGVAIMDGYRSRSCSVGELARLLQEGGEPVVVMSGRAELGPRALGNRSILASATTPGMKDTLNIMKGREDYRPVSPICLEDRAPAMFDPGSPDPYMLFEHQVRPGWVAKLPAIVHLDGTARLQTVNSEQNPTIARLLSEYERYSGVAVLCNTSANRNGSGFFPDVESALSWGAARFVWSDDTLWERTEPKREFRSG